MRGLFAKIAALIAAMPRAVWRWALVAGEWVSRLVFEQPAAGAEIAPLENEAVVDQRQPDPALADIRAVAAMLQRDQMPPPDLLSRIKDQHMQWLVACSNAMLASIVSADDKSLRDHVAGRKALRCVLITDPETVAAYRRPVMTHEGMADEDTLAWQPAH